MSLKSSVGLGVLAPANIEVIAVNEEAQGICSRIEEKLKESL